MILDKKYYNKDISLSHENQPIPHISMIGTDLPVNFNIEYPEQPLVQSSHELGSCTHNVLEHFYPQIPGRTPPISSNESLEIGNISVSNSGYHSFYTETGNNLSNPVNSSFNGMMILPSVEYSPTNYIMPLYQPPPPADVNLNGSFCYQNSNINDLYQYPNLPMTSNQITTYNSMMLGGLLRRHSMDLLICVIVLTMLILIVVRLAAISGV